MAMELERQREVGARIKQLRGPRPQPVVADKVGVTLRAYHAWEAGESGIAWRNLQKLAAVFGVSENYLLYGSEEPRGAETQLDRIEEKLDDILSRLPEADPGADLERELEEAALEHEQQTPDSAPNAQNPRRRGPARRAPA
ncbi:MAG TPA: helix-turn-helix transcriptional regulator [Solirubrobacteraceae bacterium]|jgi:transcriptional regulator with XRE-family HTH domain|nr:helix-turn-helix transcriptional regulator [Solirubrobacteraceae bacterium]